MISPKGHIPLSALLGFLWVFGGTSLSACKPGSEITEYQAPAHILKIFHTDHPHAESATYRQMTRDGVKVYLIQYQEGEEDKEAWYTAQGKPFISKAERRTAEEVQKKLQEERDAKAQEEAEEKAARDAEHPPATALPAKPKAQTQTSSPSQTPAP
jgi:hypothetical protein